jgi:DNA segregation ATPase FtsK/SpoIIIE-like protein
LYTEYTRSVRPRWQIYVTILGFVLSCTVSVLGAQYRNLLVIAAGMAGILASGFLMALPTTQARNFMVQVNMHGAGRARETVLQTGDYLLLTQGFMTTRYPYAWVTALSETREFYVLELGDPIVILVRKGHFTVGREEDFMPYLREKCRLARAAAKAAGIRPENVPAPPKPEPPKPVPEDEFPSVLLWPDDPRYPIRVAAEKAAAEKAAAEKAAAEKAAAEKAETEEAETEEAETEEAETEEAETEEAETEEAETGEAETEEAETEEAETEEAETEETETEKTEAGEAETEEAETEEAETEEAETEEAETGEAAAEEAETEKAETEEAETGEAETEEAETEEAAAAAQAGPEISAAGAAGQAGHEKGRPQTGLPQCKQN